MNTLRHDSELYFERGGPSYRFMQRIGLIQGESPSVGRRIIAFLAITWVPLFLFALVDGHALGATPRESFLLDFASYARFFIAVPLLIAAEVIVGPRLASAGLGFLHGGFVRPADQPAFARAVKRVVRWRESFWAEMILAGIALTAAWTLTAESFYGGDKGTWTLATSDGGTRLSLAGMWYKIIALPILQFLWYRWLWRLFILARFLGAVSRLDLDLVPTHADEAGGLGFLGMAHLSLGVFAFGVSSVLCADAAFRIVFEGASIENFKVVAIVQLVTTQIICLGPLLVFMPIMARKRRQALREYSLLVDRYNREFHEKWVAGKAPEGEQLLGSADIQSLADLGGSFEFIRSMKLVPFGLRVVLQLAVVAALPAVPLLPLVMPWEEILKFIAGAMF